MNRDQRRILIEVIIINLAERVRVRLKCKKEFIFVLPVLIVSYLILQRRNEGRQESRLWSKSF